MLFNLSPFMMFFSSIYIILSSLLAFSSDNFFVTWIYMELHMILFVVISSPFFKNSSSSLILFFLVQSAASLMMLVGSVTSNYLVLMTSFLMKLGSFPFHGWYLSSLSGFSCFPLFLALTIQKFPSMVIFSIFSSFMPFSLFLALIVFMALGPLVALPYSHSLNLLLVWSSAISSIWMLLSASISLGVFLVFLFIYAFALFMLLFVVKVNSYMSYFIILTLSGFPPFPLFFMKLYIIYTFSATVFGLIPALLVLSLSVLMTNFYASWVLSKLTLKMSIL